MVKKVIVGMSGGVDSSVTAYLLKEQGYEVAGVMMLKGKTFSNKDVTDAMKSCSEGNSQANIDDAKAVCEKIGIEFKTIDVTEEYNRQVLDYFKSEYLSGRTPNPCIKCNTVIKFGLLPKMIEKAIGSFDYFATGHYANIVYDDETSRYNLKMGENKAKDQSYFLYRLSQEQLAKIMFPLGKYKKEDIRKIAKDAGLVVFDKKDSQDFYSGDYSNLLNVKPKQGNIISSEGRILGKHQGFWNYTVGQRKGLGVSAPHPLYVIDVNAERNEVIVGENLYSEMCEIDDVVFSSINSFKEKIKGRAKFRSAQQTLSEAYATEYDFDTNTLKIEFASPAKALTKGQSLVLYDENDIVICGGILK